MMIQQNPSKLWIASGSDKCLWWEVEELAQLDQPRKMLLKKQSMIWWTPSAMLHLGGHLPQLKCLFYPLKDNHDTWKMLTHECTFIDVESLHTTWSSWGAICKYHWQNNYWVGNNTRLPWLGTPSD